MVTEPSWWRSISTVVLGPVELDAAGDPGAGETDERRLDDVLTIEEVVAVDLVEADVDSAADLGQNHQPHEAVLQMDGFPGFNDRLAGDAVDQRQRIDVTTAALIDALFEKHGIEVGGRRQVTQQIDGLLPGLHLFVL
jgi:hypothetical protein